MAATLHDRVAAASAAPPLNDLCASDRDELEREVAQASDLEDLPGRWQAAILSAESGAAPAGGCCHHC